MATSVLYQAAHRRYDPREGGTTPGFEISEGIRLAQNLIPAPYLPTVRNDSYYDDYFVMSAGIPVSLDSKGWVIPAGLALQYQYAHNLVTVCFFATDATAMYFDKYTAADVTAGIKNMRGETVKAGEPVICSIWQSNATAIYSPDTSGTEINTMWFGAVGVLPYDAWRWYMNCPDLSDSTNLATNLAQFYGGEGEPTYGRAHNYKLQAGITVLTRYYVEVPIVIVSAISGTTVDSPAYAGQARAVQVTATTASHLVPGCKVGYDYNSRYIRIDAENIGGGNTFFDAPTPTAGVYTESTLQTAYDNAEKMRSRIVGQCIYKEPWTNYPLDYLNRVRTAYNMPNSTEFGQLDKMPGSATAGLPGNMAYATAAAATSSTMAGTCRFNIVCNAR